MVSSQSGMFGDGKLERFSNWFSTFPRSTFPKDYLWFDKKCGGFIWYYMYSQDIVEPEELPIITFQGGLYADTTDIDGKDNSEVISKIKEFIGNTKRFEEDPSREYLGNIITPPSANKILGYNQMDYYVPIKVKDERQ